MGVGPQPPGTDARRGGSQGLSTRAKVAVGAFIAVLYAVGMSLRGDVAPGIVGGILAGVLAFLVLREIEQRRERRERSGGRG